MRRPLALALVLGSTLLGVGCGGAAAQARPPRAGEQGALAPVAVGDDDFARQAQAVLTDGTATPERRNLLAGLVRRQLARSASRFEAGHPSAGLASLTGAFYLTRAGELDPRMLEGGVPALQAGAAQVARRGDEGQSHALYSLLRVALPAGPERDQVEAHLTALDRWSRETRSPERPLGAAAAEQRASASRFMLLGSPEALEQARRATLRWMELGVQRLESDAPVRSLEERDETLEAYRAARAGGTALVALHLRQGDPAGALQGLAQADLLRAVPPGLRDRLERAAAQDDPQAWLDLFQLFDTLDEAASPENALDSTLTDGAAWGAALELHRSAPNSPDAAPPLARALALHGMADAAMALLAGAPLTNATPESMSFALSLLIASVAAEDALGDPAAARRIMAAAAPLLTRAEGRDLLGRIDPSPARAHYVAAAIQTRAGELEHARPHALAATQRLPDLDALRLLGAIDRQRGAFAEAARSFDAALELCRRAGDASCEADIGLQRFELLRETPGADPAPALAQALARALDARQGARDPAERGRAERLLGRILEQYGDRPGARRATERAHEAARGDYAQLTASVLDASRRALVMGDVPMAREALERAVALDLAGEDLVYVSLWLMLTEQRAGVPSDGAALQALGRVDPEDYWPARLSAWARGKLDDAGLRATARSLVQRTEADFYPIMLRSRAGQPLPAELTRLAQSPAIELVEVWVARDLFLREKAGDKGRFTLPPSARVP